MHLLILESLLKRQGGDWDSLGGWQQSFWEFILPQAGFRNGGGNRDQIANICWIMEKAREFQKNIYFCFIDYANVLDCVDHNKL